jgi:hypothetical protein
MRKPQQGQNYFKPAMIIVGREVPQQRRCDLLQGKLWNVDNPRVLLKLVRRPTL